jgi:flagellar basal body-associated protein FliL
MKREIDVPGNKLIVLYRIIVAMLLLMVLLLITGSLYAFIRSRDSGPLFRIGSGSRDAVPEIGSDIGVFSGIGTLRIQNKGASRTTASSQTAGQSNAAVIIVSISFPYKAYDRLFTEELASHIGEFRSIATNYFADLPADKLSKLDEEQVKADILKQYNALLRLGKIETLFFGDLMIVE